MRSLRCEQHRRCPPAGVSRRNSSARARSRHISSSRRLPGPLGPATIHRGSSRLPRPCTDSRTRPVVLWWERTFSTVLRQHDQWVAIWCTYMPWLRCSSMRRATNGGTDRLVRACRRESAHGLLTALPSGARVSGPRTDCHVTRQHYWNARSSPPRAPGGRGAKGFSKRTSPLRWQAR